MIAVENSGDVKFLIWRRVSLSFVIANAICLSVTIAWLCTARDSGSAGSPVLDRLKWWSQPWGVYIPLVTGARETVASEGALVASGMIAGLTLAAGGFVTVTTSRKQRAAGFGLAFLVACGWLAIGVWYEDLRLRAESADLIRHAERVQAFAKRLNESWPSEGGEIENFGAFVAYPYDRPRTLLMLGDATIPDTTLRVAAIERSANEAIRFQLTGDAPRIWFEWRCDGDSPSTFTGGLSQVHHKVSCLEIDGNVHVVRYMYGRP